MYIKIMQCITVSFAFALSFEIPIPSIIPLLLGGLYGMLLWGLPRRVRKIKDKMSIYLVSALFALFILFSQIEVILQEENNLLCLVSFILSACGLFLFFRLVIEQLCFFLLKDGMVFAERKNPWKAAYVFWGAFGILLLIWGINFAIDFPGHISVDTLENLEQSMGIRKMDVLFPFYMTLYLRFCWNVGILLWGSGNIGIGLYCGTQMIWVALCVAYLIYRIYTYNVKRTICAAVLAYFIFIPYHAHSSYTLLKDVPYAVGTFMLILLTWEFYVDGEPISKLKKILKYTGFVLAGILMALSRANGYYAFIFSFPFLLYLFIKKQKEIVLLLIVTFLAVIFVRGPVFDFVITQNNQYVTESKTPVFEAGYEQETISDKSETTTTVKQNKVNNASSEYGATGIFIITAQQLGRVTVDRELTEAEYERLSSIIDVEEMKATYNKHIVTNAMNQITNWNTKEYLSVWLEFGLKYPYTYFIAWRDQTQGYWNPNLFTGEMELEFTDRNPEVYKDGIGSNKLANMKIEIYEKVMEHVPIIPLLWCNGFIVWITFFTIALTAVKRNWISIFLYMPLVGLWLTLMVANPCDGQFRYIYSFFLCLPMSILIPFIKAKNES